MGRMKLRRALAAVLPALCLALPAEAGTLYVTNRGSGELAILDDTSLAVRTVIPIGPEPWGVAVGREQRVACVGYAGGVAVVDLIARTVERWIGLGGRGMGVAIARDGSECYVAVNGEGGDRLVALRPLDGWVRGEVAIGARAFALYLSHDARFLYVPEPDAFALSVVEVATLTRQRTVPLRPLGPGPLDKPHYLVLSPDGRKLYLPFQGLALVIVDTVSFSTTSRALTIDAHQQGIAITRDGRRLFVVNNVLDGEGSLSELELPSLREVRRIQLDGHHAQVALDRGARRAYLTGGFPLGTRGHDELSVVDLATGTVTRASTGGTTPFAIVAMP